MHMDSEREWLAVQSEGTEGGRETAPLRSAAEVLAELSAAVDAALAAHAGGQPEEVREVRALEIFDIVPAGHVAVPVTDERWEPHLHPGEFAVLDAADVEPQLGELYGITISSPRFAGGHVLRIVQPRRSNLAGPDGVVFGFAQRQPGRLHLVDGPLTLDGWRRTCRGRVVGVLAPIGGEAP